MISFQIYYFLENKEGFSVNIEVTGLHYIVTCIVTFTYMVTVLHYIVTYSSQVEGSTPCSLNPMGPDLSTFTYRNTHNCRMNGCSL